ncbi:hypothetical protein OIU74_003196 [Salix koriyanagi]|uniref:Uncharacterized protein n=1 Tax=Salix koriyanagi TaxID=2511006 RepID=A0A9Q0ZKW1_9ROSI|nr:hypothetical protein OIU74_003196 [Salix koriyanagi]
MTVEEKSSFFFNYTLDTLQREKRETKNTEETVAYKEYLTGLLAGVATVITDHLFDTVKVKLQKHNKKHMGLSTRMVCIALLGYYRLSYTVSVKHFTSYSVPYSQMIIVIDRLKDCTEGKHHLLLGWLLRVPFFLAYILKQSSHRSIWWSYYQFRIMPIRASKRCKFKEITPWFQKFNRYSGPLDCALQKVKNEGHFSWRFYNVAFWTAVLPLDVAKTIIQTSPDKSSTRNPFLILYSIL